MLCVIGLNYWDLWIEDSASLQTIVFGEQVVRKDESHLGHGACPSFFIPHNPFLTLAQNSDPPPPPFLLVSSPPPGPTHARMICHRMFWQLPTTLTAFPFICFAPPHQAPDPCMSCHAMGHLQPCHGPFAATPWAICSPCPTMESVVLQIRSGWYLAPDV